MATGDNYDMIFKIVLIGDSYVGKTNILSRYLQNEFSQDSKATVGVEFGSKNFNIEGNNVKAQIWDTAGQERYQAITNAYYKGAKGAFIVYDITRKTSFESIDKWVTNIKANGHPNLSIILVGNKCDLESNRGVSKSEAEQLAKNYNVAFLETSALNGSNVDKAFEMMMKDVYNKFHVEFEGNVGLEINEGKGIELKKNDEKKEKKCCKN